MAGLHSQALVHSPAFHQVVCSRFLHLIILRSSLRQSCVESTEGSHVIIILLRGLHFVILRGRCPCSHSRALGSWRQLGLRGLSTRPRVGHLGHLGLCGFVPARTSFARCVHFWRLGIGIGLFTRCRAEAALFVIAIRGCCSTSTGLASPAAKAW